MDEKRTVFKEKKSRKVVLKLFGSGCFGLYIRAKNSCSQHKWFVAGMSKKKKTDAKRKHWENQKGRIRINHVKIYPVLYVITGAWVSISTRWLGKSGGWAGRLVGYTELQIVEEK